MVDYDKNIVYCPACGMVAELPQNALGRTRFPKHMDGGICPYCDTKLLEVPEDYKKIIMLEDANWMRQNKSAEEVYQYVFEKYIKHNEQFIPEANERMIRMKMRESRQAALAYKKAIENSSRIPKCPKCGSTSISTQKQGFGVGKAAVGVVAAGPVGALAGGINANKTYNVCQNCGHKWELGK